MPSVGTTSKGATKSYAKKTPQASPQTAQESNQASIAAVSKAPKGNTEHAKQSAEPRDDGARPQSSTLTGTTLSPHKKTANRKQKQLHADPVTSVAPQLRPAAAAVAKNATALPPSKTDLYSTDLSRVYINVPGNRIFHLPSPEMIASTITSHLCTSRVDTTTTTVCEAEPLPHVGAVGKRVVVEDEGERERLRPRCLTRRLCPSVTESCGKDAPSSSSSSLPQQCVATCSDVQCPFVHAEIADLPFQETHVNYYLPACLAVDGDASNYERLPGGKWVRVCAPNCIDTFDVIETNRLLRTEGSDQLWSELTQVVAGASPVEVLLKNDEGAADAASLHRPMMTNVSHCAHFYFNRVCNRGSRCKFMHALSIAFDETDDNRGEGECQLSWTAPLLLAPLAPAPRSIGPDKGKRAGNGMHLEEGSNARNAPQAASSSPPASHDSHAVPLECSSFDVALPDIQISSVSPRGTSRASKSPQPTRLLSKRRNSCTNATAGDTQHLMDDSVALRSRNNSLGGVMITQHLGGISPDDLSGTSSARSSASQKQLFSDRDLPISPSDGVHREGDNATVKGGRPFRVTPGAAPRSPLLEAPVMRFCGGWVSDEEGSESGGSVANGTMNASFNR